MEAAPRNHNERRGSRRRMRRRAQIPAFGNWDYNNDQQHQMPISQYFDYCTTKPEPEPEPLQLHHSHASSFYPYAHSYSPAYTCYVDHDDHHPFPFHDVAPGAYNNHYEAPLQHHFNIKTSNAATEVKGSQSRPQRRRRCYLGADNNRKVFDITETEAVPSPTPPLTDKAYGHNDVVITPDLYDVGSTNVTIRKDEDLYKIPPELLRNSKRTNKMRKFFTKFLVTICASY